MCRGDLIARANQVVPTGKIECFWLYKVAMVNVKSSRTVEGCSIVVFLLTSARWPERGRVKRFETEAMYRHDAEVGWALRQINTIQYKIVRLDNIFGTFQTRVTTHSQRSRH